MQTTSSALIAVVLLSAFLGSLAWHAPDKPLLAQSPLEAVALFDSDRHEASAAESLPTFLAVVGAPSEKATTAASSATTVLKYGDGEPDGKKSLGGSGEMIRFELPHDEAKLRGIRIHGSRYGHPQPPKEDVLIYLLDADGEEILHTQKAPYSLFKRGDSKWNTVRFRRPLEVTETFWVVLDFKAGGTKGVYVSYDLSTGGENSRQGLPGMEATETGFEGDWMIQALLTD